MITFVIGIAGGIVGAWLYDLYWERRAMEEVGEYDVDAS